MFEVRVWIDYPVYQEVNYFDDEKEMLSYIKEQMILNGKTVLDFEVFENSEKICLKKVGK